MAHRLTRCHRVSLSESFVRCALHFPAHPVGSRLAVEREPRPCHCIVLKALGSRATAIFVFRAAGGPLGSALQLLACLACCLFDGMSCWRWQVNSMENSRSFANTETRTHTRRTRAQE